MKIVSSIAKVTSEDMDYVRSQIERMHPVKGTHHFAIIGLMWHSKRRASLGFRFAPTADLTETMIDDGRVRWTPLEAIDRKWHG